MIDFVTTDNTAGGARSLYFVDEYLDRQIIREAARSELHLQRDAAERLRAALTSPDVTPDPSPPLAEKPRPKRRIVL